MTRILQTERTNTHLDLSSATVNVNRSSEINYIRELLKINGGIRFRRASAEIRSVYGIYGPFSKYMHQRALVSQRELDYVSICVRKINAQKKFQLYYLSNTYTTIKKILGFILMSTCNLIFIYSSSNVGFAFWSDKSRF